jgi:hypothetical protein
LKRKTGFLLLALFLVFSASVPAGGKKDQPKTDTAELPLFRDRNGAVPAPKEKTRAEIDALETVRVSGIVRLVGSGIRTELVISSPDGEWYIEPKDEEKFRNLQQQMVSAEGKPDIEEFTLADGHSTIKRCTLRDAALVETQ